MSFGKVPLHLVIDSPAACYNHAVKTSCAAHHQGARAFQSTCSRSKVSPNHGKQRSNNKTLLQTVLVFLHRTRQNGVHCGALGCRWITSRAHRQPLHFVIYKSMCNNTDRDALAARCSCPSKLLSDKQLLLLLLRAVAGFPVQSFVTDTQSEHVTTSLQLRATSNGLEVSFGQAPARCSCCRDAPRALHVGHAGGEEHR